MEDVIRPFVVWLVFVAAFLLIANIIIRLISKKIWSKRPAAAGEDAAAISNVKPVERIWFDNPVFYLIRVGVFKLDNALFNRKGQMPDYQPPRMVLVFPFWSGVFSLPFLILFYAVIMHFVSGSGDANDDNDFYRFLIQCHTIILLLVVILNMFFARRNVFVIRDRIRKTFYPIFIAVCSAIMFLLGFWLIPIIFVFGMCIIVLF